MKQNIEGNLQEDSVLFVDGLPVYNYGQFTQVGIRVQVNPSRVIIKPVSREQAVDFLVQLKTIDFPFAISIVTIGSDFVVPKIRYEEWLTSLIGAIYITD